jgi:hypothetical protein
MLNDPVIAQFERGEGNDRSDGIIAKTRIARLFYAFGEGSKIIAKMLRRHQILPFPQSRHNHHTSAAFV